MYMMHVEHNAIHPCRRMPRPAALPVHPCRMDPFGNTHSSVTTQAIMMFQSTMLHHSACISSSHSSRLMGWCTFVQALPGNQHICSSVMLISCTAIGVLLSMQSCHSSSRQRHLCLIARSPGNRSALSARVPVDSASHPHQGLTPSAPAARQ